ncbi:hypothetical protein FA10DRAFT_285509 [Acaromyces ingoldii]|uniref:Small EDRK-rich factor-like N-terminal domain-containing protein n=1 Tax=Acaromyces ingoldii TaxID=215250 RepID=A0A316YKP6_9BASI|nr:hypothetical protein FA10DRAFT_285509 [Acaromyces ingoldii]PWN89791.1 hypothetical protein FA10DRAFT_285509 [Acaromyces ingoldii]
MVRGAAKAQAQAKNAAKQEAAKGGKSQLKDREKALKFICPQCKAPSPHYNTLKTHMESKHPKADVPPEDSFKV